MSVEFIIGEVLTTKELYTRLGISRSTWDRCKEKYIDNLNQYYPLGINGNGRSRRYTILGKLGEYEPPMSDTEKRVKQETYNQEIIAQISKPHGNVQTYRSLTTSIRQCEKNSTEKFQHKDSTAYVYVRVGTKMLFGSKAGESGSIGRCLGNVWAEKLDAAYDYSFRELSEGELKDWRESIRRNRISDEEWAELLGEMDNSEEENLDELFKERNRLSFQAAKDEFAAQYHFMPVLARKYEIKN